RPRCGRATVPPPAPPRPGGGGGRRPAPRRRPRRPPPDLLERRHAALTAQVGEIRDTVRTAGEQGVPWIFLIEEEYRRGVLEAELAFVTGLVDSLRQPEAVRAWQEFFDNRT
ncbi:hypothetical protein ACFV0G_33945, partial [Kitasatospora sp. NPDC059571]